MKTYLITVDEPQEDVIIALAKALNFDMTLVDETAEDKAMLKAMEEGKRYGRLSEEEGKDFLENLGK